MGIRGRVVHGVVLLDDSDALPDGTVVHVEPVDVDEEQSPEEGETLSEMLIR